MRWAHDFVPSSPAGLTEQYAYKKPLAAIVDLRADADLVPAALPGSKAVLCLCDGQTERAKELQRLATDYETLRGQYEAETGETDISETEEEDNADDTDIDQTLSLLKSRNCWMRATELAECLRVPPEDLDDDLEALETIGLVNLARKNGRIVKVALGGESPSSGRETSFDAATSEWVSRSHAAHASH